jgi:hypothetical protein
MPKLTLHACVERFVPLPSEDKVIGQNWSRLSGGIFRVSMTGRLLGPDQKVTIGTMAAFAKNLGLFTLYFRIETATPSAAIGVSGVQPRKCLFEGCGR